MHSIIIIRQNKGIALIHISDGTTTREIEWPVSKGKKALAHLEGLADQIWAKATSDPAIPLVDKGAEHTPLN